MRNLKKQKKQNKKTLRLAFLHFYREITHSVLLVPWHFIYITLLFKHNSNLDPRFYLNLNSKNFEPWITVLSRPKLHFRKLPADGSIWQRFDIFSPLPSQTSKYKKLLSKAMANRCKNVGNALQMHTAAETSFSTLCKSKKNNYLNLFL